MFCLPEKMNLNLSSMEAHWRPKWKSKSHEISCYYCYDFYYLVSIGAISLIYNSRRLRKLTIFLAGFHSKHCPSGLP